MRPYIASWILVFIGFTPLDSLAARNYLGNDVQIDCSDDPNQVTAIDSGGDTLHNAYMKQGETLWVGATVLAEYEASSNDYNKELVETFLMCGNDSSPTSYIDYSKVQSRSGVNHWKLTGVGSRLATTHYTKAVYEAAEDGLHTCWVIYACSQKSGHTVTFKKDKSYLTWYAVDAYPGKNWKPQGDYLVNSTATHTPGGSQIWDAGRLTQNDTEVVAYWSPRLTNCEAGDAQCGQSFDGYDADTYFDWRVVVYQYNNNTVCNKDFGVWNENIVCKHDDHHCDRLTYQKTSEIITGMGTEGYCGGSTTHRKFKIYTQIRKSHDFFSDIMVHNGWTGRSNILIYSR